jgi:hypothetical protein
MKEQAQSLEADLKEQATNLEVALEAVQTELGTTKDQAKSLEADFETSQAEHVATKEQTRNLEAAMEAAQAELGTTREQVKNLEVALEEAQAASAKTKELETSLAELDAKRKEAEDKVLTTEAALEKNKSENEAILRELESKVSDLESVNSSHVELNKSLEENKARQESELGDMRAQLDNLEDLKAKHDKISKDLEENRVHHTKQVHDLEIKLLELQDLREEHGQFRDQLQASQQREQELKSNLERAQAEVQDLRSRHSELAATPGFERSNESQKDGHFTEAIVVGVTLGVATGVGMKLEKAHEDRAHPELDQTEDIADGQTHHSAELPSIEPEQNVLPLSSENQDGGEVLEHPLPGNETREIPTGDAEELRDDQTTLEGASDAVRSEKVDISEESAERPVGEDGQADQAAEVHESSVFETGAERSVGADDEICESSEDHTDKPGHDSPEDEERVADTSETSNLEELVQDPNAETLTMHAAEKEEGSEAPEQISGEPNEDPSTSETPMHSEPTTNEADSSHQEEKEAPMEDDNTKEEELTPESEIQSSLAHPENSNVHETSELPVADQVTSSADGNDDHAISEQQHPKILDAIEGEPAVEHHITTEDSEPGEPSSLEQPRVSEESTEAENLEHEASGHVDHHIEENGTLEGDESEKAAAPLEERRANETHPDGETDTVISLGERHEDGDSHEDLAPEHKGSDTPQHIEGKSGRTENSDEQVELENATDAHAIQETAIAKTDVEANAEGTTEAPRDIQEHQEPQSETTEIPKGLENDAVEEVQVSNAELPVPHEHTEQDSNRSVVEQVSQKPEAVDNTGEPQHNELHHHDGDPSESKDEQKEIESAQAESSADEPSESGSAEQLTTPDSEEQSQGATHSSLSIVEETTTSDPQLTNNSKSDATHLGEHPAEEDNDEHALGTVHDVDGEGDHEEVASVAAARDSAVSSQINETVIIPVTKELPDTVAAKLGGSSEKHEDEEGEGRSRTPELPVPDTSVAPGASAE